MWTNKNSSGEHQSFNFIAPDGVSTKKNEVLFPWTDKQTPGYAATLAVAVKQHETFLQPATLTGAVTINLTIDQQVKAGAKLYLKMTADATARTVTFGTGFATTTAQEVAISTTVYRSFVYDGTSFVAMS